MSGRAKAYTPEEAVEVLGFGTPDWIRSRIRSGDLPAFDLCQVGGRSGRSRYQIADEDLQAFRESLRVVPDEPAVDAARRRRLRGRLAEIEKLPPLNYREPKSKRGGHR